jgi:hypothetical protein
MPCLGNSLHFVNSLMLRVNATCILGLPSHASPFRPDPANSRAALIIRILADGVVRHGPAHLCAAAFRRVFSVGPFLRLGARDKSSLQDRVSCLLLGSMRA